MLQNQTEPKLSNQAHFSWETALSSGFAGMGWWLVGMPSEGMKGPSVSLFPKHWSHLSLFSSSCFLWICSYWIQRDVPARFKENDLTSCCTWHYDWIQAKGSCRAYWHFWTCFFVYIFLEEGKHFCEEPSKLSRLNRIIVHWSMPA